MKGLCSSRLDGGGVAGRGRRGREGAQTSEAIHVGFSLNFWFWQELQGNETKRMYVS